MPINYSPLAESIRHSFPFLVQGVRVVVVACLIACGVYGCLCLTRLPVHPLLKVIFLSVLLVILSLLGWLIVTTTPLLAAKVLLIVLLVAGILACLLCLSQVGRWHATLCAIQQECELATNLTYLQGEMTRHQLEILSDKLKHACQPEEREITETVLKTVSPLLMLYFRKEKSILKWSAAAASIGRGLFDYFWSPRRN